jgi:hypothetical protein
MNEDNDLLLKQFFSEAAQQTIDDNGFTERVMGRLPQVSHGLGFFFASQSPIKHFSRLWTMFCILVFVVLFVIFDGWQQLAIQFEVLLRTMSVSSFSINLLMLASILFGLLFVGVEESVSRA